MFFLYIIYGFQSRESLPISDMLTVFQCHIQSIFQRPAFNNFVRKALTKIGIDTANYFVVFGANYMFNGLVAV